MVNDFMAKTYFQPEVTVAHFESTTLMQAASPAGGQMGISDIPTNVIW